MLKASILSLGLIATSGLAWAGGACGENKPTAQVVHASYNEPAKPMDIVDTAVGAGSFNTLVAALKAAGLVDALKGPGPLTVFAPTDAAFAKLPAGALDNLLKPENKSMLQAILKHHVVPGRALARDVSGMKFASTLAGQRVDIRTSGGKVMVDNATVTTVDIAATNGVIHVIDSVLMPAGDDIIDTAVQAGSFKTLAAALEAAGLISTLKGDGPFTVFAPTDEAFAKLPAGSVENLLKPENRAKLTAILTFHVVPGRIYSDQAVAAKSAKTIQGESVNISVVKGQPMVQNAKIIKADVEATNGVIHVIDTVIMPKGS